MTAGGQWVMYNRQPCGGEGHVVSDTKQTSTLRRTE